MIGAPTGTKMSQGTPNWRAAKASAWAWLPALPAVTPAAAPAPSDATLFIAPRSLKAPVRWRLSALSTMSPPTRSVSAADVTIGVCLATAEVTRRAASMSASPIGGASDSMAMRTRRYCSVRRRPSVRIRPPTARPAS